MHQQFTKGGASLCASFDGVHTVPLCALWFEAGIQHAAEFISGSIGVQNIAYCLSKHKTI